MWPNFFIFQVLLDYGASANINGFHFSKSLGIKQETEQSWTGTAQDYLEKFLPLHGSTQQGHKMSEFRDRTWQSSDSELMNEDHKGT